MVAQARPWWADFRPQRRRKRTASQPAGRVTVRSVPDVLLDIDDAGIARLTLNRPDAANGIDTSLARALLAAAEELAERSDVRVVVLTGAGARFCGGGDVRSFAGADDTAALLREITGPLHRAIELLTALPAPIVAAVQGSAAGAGMGLVAASDLVVSAASSKFVMAYTGIGLTPDGSTTWFLPRLVGYRRAVELALTNRVLSAAEAREIGLITEVVDDDALEHPGRAAGLDPRRRPDRRLRRGEAIVRSLPDLRSGDPDGTRVRRDRPCRRQRGWSRRCRRILRQARLPSSSAPDRHRHPRRNHRKFGGCCSRRLQQPPRFADLERYRRSIARPTAAAKVG